MKLDKSPHKIVELLKSSDYQERQHGLQCLQKIENFVFLKNLGKLCQNESFYIKESFLDVLENCNLAKSRKLWESYLKDGDPLIRQRACRFLFDHSNCRDPKLLREIVRENSYEEVVEKALEQILTHPHKKKLAKDIAKFLYSSRESVVLKTVEIMREAKNTGATAKLAQLHSHSKKQVRKHAVLAIGEIEPQNPQPAQVFLQDPRDEVRAAAVWAYGQIAGKKALDKWEKLIWQERSSEVQAQIIRQVGKLSHTRSVQLLLQCYSRFDDHHLKLLIEAEMDHIPPVVKNPIIVAAVESKFHDLVKPAAHFAQKYDLVKPTPYHGGLPNNSLPIGVTTNQKTASWKGKPKG